MHEYTGRPDLPQAYVPTDRRRDLARRAGRHGTDRHTQHFVSMGCTRSPVSFPSDRRTAEDLLSLVKGSITISASTTAGISPQYNNRCRPVSIGGLPIGNGTLRFRQVAEMNQGSLPRSHPYPVPRTGSSPLRPGLHPTLLPPA